jgi:hypothetical protein
MDSELKFPGKTMDFWNYTGYSFLGLPRFAKTIRLASTEVAQSNTRNKIQWTYSMAAARRRTIIDGGMATTESASLYASSSRGSFLRDWKSHNPSEHETIGHEMLQNVHFFPLDLHQLIPFTFHLQAYLYGCNRDSKPIDWGNLEPELTWPNPELKKISNQIQKRKITENQKRQQRNDNTEGRPKWGK